MKFFRFLFQKELDQAYQRGLQEGSQKEKPAKKINYDEDPDDCDGYDCHGCSPCWNKDRLRIYVLPHLSGQAYNDLLSLLNQNHDYYYQKGFEDAKEASAKLCILTPQEMAEGDWGIEASYASRYFSERIRNQKVRKSPHL